MGHAVTSGGFRRIKRHDGIFEERAHDAYKAKGKLPEPTACMQCGAVFHAGRWQWIPVPSTAHRDICPACHRSRDYYPAGFLSLKGAFLQSHRAEIMRLVHNHELYERAEHPLKRIMAVEEKEGATLVTTTDIHLARSLGDALHRAYHGELEYHYSTEQNQLRVSWTH